MTEPRTYEYVCDSGTAKRLLRLLTGRLRVIAVLELLLAGFLVLLNLTTPEGDWFWPAMLAVLGLFFLWQTRSSRLAATLGEGKRLLATFGDTEVEFSNALASSRVPYSSFASVKAKGDVVVFKLKGSRCRYGHPIEVFPVAEVEAVRRAAGI